MTPSVYQLLKYVILMPTSIDRVVMGKTVILAFMSYLYAIMARDAVYWPIVAQIVSEVSKPEIKQAYRGYQIL